MRLATLAPNALVLALVLVQLTGPDGRQRIDINPNRVTSVRDPSGPKGHLAHGTHCVLGMSNGKFIAVSEDCATVRQRVGPGPPPCTLVCAGEGPLPPSRPER